MNVVVVVVVVVQETTTTIRPWSVKYYERTTTSEFDIKPEINQEKEKRIRWKSGGVENSKGKGETVEGKKCRQSRARDAAFRYFWCCFYPSPPSRHRPEM